MLSNLSALLSKSSTLGGVEANNSQVKLKEGDNRFVSVLFADIKGFTAMSELLNPDVLQDLTDQLMLSFSERVGKYGGYVDKYEGDRIMVHFGSLGFLENNARRAVYAGLELIEVIKLFNNLKGSIPELSQVNTDLAVRVGVNSGMVATGKVGLKREGDFTIYGDVVNVASRMEEMGLPMQVMLPNAMKESLEGYFEFSYRGELTVKGKSLPMKTWLVSSVISSQVSRLLSQSEFVGRQNELNKISELYRQNLEYQSQDMHNGDMDIVLISALAGMGKTRLIKEFLKTIPETARLVSEISPVYQPPYSSFRQIVRRVFSLSEDLTQESAKEIIFNSLNSEQSKDYPLEELRSLIHQLAFVAGFALEPVSDEQAQEDVLALLNQSMLQLLRYFAHKQAEQGQLLVLAFDDLHFIDEASLKCLRFLLKNFYARTQIPQTHASRVLVLLSYRKGQYPEDLVPIKARVTKLDLAEFNPQEIELLIHQALRGIDVPAYILAEVARKSAGNPFYLEEWIAVIKRRACAGENLDIFSFKIPENVLELILARLMSLDKSGVILLQKASAIGQEFFKSILCQVDQRLAPQSDIDLTMEQTCALEFLDVLPSSGYDQEYCFKHNILHQAVYESILSINRTIMHKTIAEVIEEKYQEALPQWLFALEHHYSEGEDSKKWLHYLRESIGYARSVFMNQKTLEYCDKFLAHATSSEQSRIKILKASVLLDMGNYKEAEGVILELDLDLNQNSDLVDDYILAKTRLLMARGDILVARSYLESHLEMISTEIARNNALITHLDIKRQCKDYHEFESVAGELLCKLSSDRYNSARLENIIALYFQNLSQYARALEYLDKALEHSQNHKNLSAKIYHNKANILIKLGQPEKAVICYQQALHLAKFMDDGGMQARVCCDLGEHFKSQGHMDKAGEMLHESYDMAVESGNNHLAAEVFYNQACLKLAQGQTEVALEMGIECRKRFQQMHNYKGLSHVHDLLGDGYFSLGKYDEAEATYLENLSFQEKISDLEGIAHTYGNLANVAACRKQCDLAAEYYQKEARILCECGDVEGEAKLYYNWAIMDEEQGKIPEAIDKLKQAIKLFSQGGFSEYLPDAEDYLHELEQGL